MAAGGIAGGVSLTLTYPLNVAHKRYTNEVGNRTNMEFKGACDAMAKIFKADGITALYRGFWISQVGIVAYRGLYFGLFDTFRHKMAKDCNVFSLWLMAQSVTMSAGIATYPLDLIRARRVMDAGRRDKNYGHSFNCA